VSVGPHGGPLRSTAIYIGSQPTKEACNVAVQAKYPYLGPGNGANAVTYSAYDKNCNAIFGLQDIKVSTNHANLYVTCYLG